MKKKFFFWSIIWSAYILLAFDFWNWEKTTKIIFGIPSWIYWDALLVFSLVPVLFFLVSHEDDQA
ncbi:hypothetical protein JW890_08855 [candidate division WOR-3 bacterium]|nr:hypothetical protein [candidate division WOR-3 bacterium]